MEEEKKVKTNACKDTESVISFYLKNSEIVRWTFIILAGIVLLAGLIMAEESDGISFIVGIIVGLVLIGESIIMQNSFKWKAYMLKNTYETNLNTKK